MIPTRTAGPVEELNTTALVTTRDAGHWQRPASSSSTATTGSSITADRRNTEIATAQLAAEIVLRTSTLFRVPPAGPVREPRNDWNGMEWIGPEWI